MKYRFFIIITAILFVFNELLISEAFAYLDPGTGSMIIQSLIGALVAAGIALKIYWTKIKYAFSERKSKSKNG
mgnify:FL=1